MSAPKYLNTHEWVLTHDNIAQVGLSSYQAMHLGELNLLVVPVLNKEFKKGDVIGSIESVKENVDFHMPLSGKIVNVNADVVNNPSLITEHPLENWIIEIEFNDPNELNELLSKEQYEANL
jgi:glycine cleavage system H protein